MTTGATIFHLLDPHTGSRELAALENADARDIALASARLVPHCHHRLIHLPPGGVLRAAISLRRVARPLDGRGLVHCYSRRGASAARLAFGRQWPIVLSMGGEWDESPRALGIGAPDRVLLHAIRVRPETAPLGGLDAAWNGHERSELRRALGIGDEAVVVGALSEPRGACNARWLVFFAGILVAGGLDLTVLVPRGSAQVARMRRFHATTRLNLRVIQVEEGGEIRGVGTGLPSAWDACDLAIARPDSHASGVSGHAVARAIRRSHLAGVPVIAARDQALGELYPDAISSTLVVAAGTTKQIARSLTALIQDRDLRIRTREIARLASLATLDESRLGSVIRDAYGDRARGWLHKRTHSEAIA